MTAKCTRLLVVPIITLISLLSASCSSRLSVDLGFADVVEISYLSFENEISLVRVINETDVNTFKSIFSGMAFQSDQSPFSPFTQSMPPFSTCCDRALTYLNFVGASEAFVIRIGSHGEAMPQDFNGSIRMDPDEWETFLDLISIYIPDMSNEQDWLLSG